MVTAAVLGAVALVLWPDSGVLRRRRLRAVIGDGRVRTRGASVLRSLPVAPAVAALAALISALLSTPLVAVLSGLAAFLGVRAGLRARVANGADERVRSLADGLGALAADLRSGRALDAATAAAVAACADDEAGAALARAVAAPTAVPPPGEGSPFGQALDRIAAGARLSRRTGCSLAAVAGAVEDDLRARHRHRLELRAATAAPRASAWLLAGLPVLGLAMGAGVGADPWGVLTGTGAGQVLLVAGVALEAAGLAWSGRLVARALR